MDNKKDDWFKHYLIYKAMTDDEEDDNNDNYSRSKNDNNSTGCGFYIIMFLIIGFGGWLGEQGVGIIGTIIIETIVIVIVLWIANLFLED